jgi:hypothetical protein
MFHRGQRVIVRESSAKKRAHPNTGDVGYMGSAFLFYRERFILMDAEFFSYPGYSPGERKSERKRFIIDLGMSSSFKRKLVIEGRSKNWYIRNNCVVNLNPVDTVLSATWFDLPTLAGLWPFAYEMVGRNNRLNINVKIPVGRIASMNDNKHPLGKYGANNLKAWLRVMSPIIDISYRAGNNTIGESNDILRRLWDLYRHVHNHLTMKKEYNVTRQYLFELSDYTVNEPAQQEAVIVTVKHMQAINAMQRLKQEGFMAKHYIDDKIVPAISDIVRKQGIKELINGGIKTIDSSKALDVIESILFRALIMPGNTYNRLCLLRDLIQLDGEMYNDSWCAEMTEKIDKIKEEAKSDSAALTRIFDGTLIS